MRTVSGTSGAAPVGREVVLALHRDRAGHAPARPDAVPLVLPGPGPDRLALVDPGGGSVDRVLFTVR